MNYIITFKTEPGNIKTECYLTDSLQEAEQEYLYASQHFAEIRLWSAELKEVKIEVIVNPLPYKS